MSTVSIALLRRLLPAALVAAATTLGGSAIGEPTVACAAPDNGREWDIGEYDACVAKGGHPMDCCVASDGDWISTGESSTEGYCAAPPLNPPADAQTAPPPPPPEVVGRPGVTPAPDAATQTPTPRPIVTFTPVPADPG
jgi:hypothetical protein